VIQGSTRETHLLGLWRASIAATPQFLPIPVTAAAFVVAAGSSVAAALSTPTHLVPFALIALGITLVSTGFSVWRLARARRGITAFAALAARFAEVPPQPSETVSAPAAILQPDDAASVAHLDRILRHDRADWPAADGAQTQAVRATTFAAIAMIIASLAMIGFAVVFLLAIVGVVPNDHVIVPQICLLAAALGPLFSTGSVVSSVTIFSRVEYAREWLRAQELLNAGHLRYDGESLTLITPHAGGFVADPALAPQASRPSPKHFDMVRRGHRVDPLRAGLGWTLVPVAASALAVVLAAIGN
jgi:hypothetical protein